MKKLTISLLVLLLPALLYAIPGDNLGSETLNTYKIGTSTWYPIFKQASLYLFWAFATIELVIVFGMKAVKGELEITGVFAELTRIVLLFGLFMVFYDKPEWIDSIFKGFSALGDKGNVAAGISTVVSIDSLTDSAAELLASINENQSWWKPADSIVLGLIGLIAALTILFLGIALLTTYIKFLLYLNLSVLFFAFGAFSYTRQWAYNAVTNVAKAGTEYMLIKLVIGLAITNIKTQAPTAMSDEGSLFSLLITVLMIFGITQMIHSMVESFFSGQGAANSGHLSGMTKGVMMGAAAGATGGAAAAIKQIKAANEMADVAGTSGVGKTKSTAGTIAGGFIGAATGAAKGAMGFNTNTAGGKSGSVAGKAAASKTNKTTNMSMKESSSATTSKGSEDTSIGKNTKKSEPTLKPGDKGFYHSSVPNQKDKK